MFPAVERIHLRPDSRLPGLVQKLLKFVPGALLAGLLVMPAPGSASVLDHSFGDGFGRIDRVQFTSPGFTRPIGITTDEAGFRVISIANGDVGVFAFDRDGTPDLDFRGRGWHTYEMGPGLGADSDIPTAFTLANDGSLFVASSSYPVVRRPKSSQVIVMLDRSGFPDPSFGKGGAVRMKGLSPARSVLASSRTVFTVSRKFIDGDPPRKARSQIKVAAISRNGELDRRFAGDGVMTLNGWQPSFRPGGAVLDSRGLPVILASREVKSGFGIHDSSRLVAITERGEIDRDLGRNGKFENPPFPFSGSELVKTTGGNLVVLARRIPGYTPVLLSYRANGTLDNDFGERGVVEFDGYAEKLAALAGGQVAILSTEGMLTKFDRYGEVLGQTGPIPSRSRAAIGGDGYGVVTTGWSRLDPAEHPYVRGFGPDLSPQPQLETNSRTGQTMEYEYWSGYEQLISLPDGNLVSLDRATPTMQFAVSRMGRDGSLDPDFGAEGRIVIEEEQFGSAVSLLPGPGSSALLVGPDYRSRRSVTMLRIAPDGSRSSSELKGFKRFYFSDATVAKDDILVA